MLSYKNPETKEKLHWILLSYINTAMFGIYIVPYGFSYSPYTDDWLIYYILDESVFPFSVFFLPVTMFWLLYRLLKNSRFRLVSQITLLIWSGVCSLMSLGEAVVPLQDSSPHIGVLISLSYFPALLIFMLNEGKLIPGVVGEKR